MSEAIQNRYEFVIVFDVENGEMPEAEMPRICQMVEDICYYNAKHYFEF